MKKRRTHVPLVVLVTLLAVLAVSDWAVGVLLVEGDTYGGRALPPFGTFDSAEVRARLTKRLELELQKRARRPDAPSTFDALLGWKELPGRHEGSSESGTINSIGARGAREYAPEPPPGVVRIACFGESFTFGAEVADEECWPAQLEARHPRIEAVNLGVNGYGTDQALLRFRREGSHGAQVVAIGLLLENIARNVSRFRSLLYADTAHPVVKPRFVLEDGRLRLVPIPYADRVELYSAALSGALRKTMSENDFWAGDEPLLGFSNLARILAGRRAARRRAPWTQWCRPDGEPYRVTLAILQAFHDEALEAGAEHVLVLVFPTREDQRIFAGGRPAWYEHLLGDLAARGIESLDVSRALESAPEGTPLFRERHFSPAANGLVAERVAVWLDEHCPEAR